MTRHLGTMVCVGLVLSTTGPMAKGKCKDVPVRVTLFNNAVADPDNGTTVPAALRSDGGAEYTSASIKICSGTNDAVVNLSGTNRTFIFDFPSPIAGSATSNPSWVGSARAVSGWLNVRNITYSKDAFATHVGSTFTVSGDRATYRLGFRGQHETLSLAPNLHDPELTGADNTPFPSSPAVVYPSYPLTCGPGNMPTWLVRGTSPNFPDPIRQVGTLYKQPSKPTGTATHQGQYSLPFEMRIEALACFTYPAS